MPLNPSDHHLPTRTRSVTKSTEIKKKQHSNSLHPAMSRFQNRLGHRCYGYDRQGERYTGQQHHRSDVRPHGTDYGYVRPRRMLVAVKEGMLHPKPPTYRRLDMDETLRKLPIEHCRTSTSRSVGIYITYNNNKYILIYTILTNTYTCYYMCIYCSVTRLLNADYSLQMQCRLQY